MSQSRPKTPGSESHVDDGPTEFNVVEDELDGDKYVLVALEQSESLPVHWPKREPTKPPPTAGRGKDAQKKKKKAAGKAGDYFKPDVADIPFSIPDHFSPASSDKCLQAAIDGYAKRLGVDPESDPQLMWIVEECFKAPLPDGWKLIHIPNGTHLYVHRSGEALEDNPVTIGYRKMIADMRFNAAQQIQRIMRGYLLRHRLARYMEGRDRRNMDTHALIHAVSRQAVEKGPTFMELTREQQWKLLVATSNSLENFMSRVDAVDQLVKAREELAEMDAAADEERREALQAELTAKSALLGEDVAMADVEAMKAKFSREPPTSVGTGAQVKAITEVEDNSTLHRNKSTASINKSTGSAPKDKGGKPAPTSKKGQKPPAEPVEPEVNETQDEGELARRALMGDLSTVEDVTVERPAEEPEDYLLKHGYEAYWTYANYLLGNRPEASGLMWLVEKAYKTPLPRGWQVVHLFNMTPIFFNRDTGAMSATNPIDEHYREVLDNIQFKAAQKIQARIRGALVRGRNKAYVATATARMMVDRVFTVSTKFIVADKKHFEDRFSHLRTRAFNRRHVKKMAIKIQRTARRWMFGRQLRKKLDRTEWYVKKLEGMLKNEQDEYIKMHKRLKTDLEDAQKSAKLSEEELKERIRESRKVSREKALLKQQFNKFVAEFEEEAQVLRVQYNSMKQLADERLNRMRAIEGETIQELMGKMGRRESGILKYRQNLKDSDDSRMRTETGDVVGGDENPPLGVDNYKGEKIVSTDHTVESGIVVNASESHPEGYPTSVLAPSVSPNNNENYMKFLSEYLPPETQSAQDQINAYNQQQAQQQWARPVAHGPTAVTGSYGKSYGRYIPPSDPYFESKYHDDGTPKDPDQEIPAFSPPRGKKRSSKKGSQSALSRSAPSLEPYRNAKRSEPDWRPQTSMFQRNPAGDRSGLRTQGGRRGMKEYDPATSPYSEENKWYPQQHKQYMSSVQRSMTKLGQERRDEAGLLPQIAAAPQPAPGRVPDDKGLEISVVRERKKTEHELLFGDMKMDSD